MQRVERRLLIQAVAALSHEPFERLTLRVVRLARLKQRERQLQRRQLQLHHGGVIHPLRGARLGQLLLRRRLLPPALRRIAALEILHRVDVDIRQIQPAARRGVRAGALRVGRIQRMDRIETDEGTAALPTCSTIRRRSPKSPMPQLRSERSVYS